MDNALTPAPAPRPQVIQNGSVYLVESFTEPGTFYSVRLQGERLTCTCPAFRFSQAGVCKHLAVANEHAVEARAVRKVPATVALEPLDEDERYEAERCDNCREPLAGDEGAQRCHDGHDPRALCSSCVTTELGLECRLEQLISHTYDAHPLIAAALIAMRPAVSAATKQADAHATEVRELQTLLAKVRQDRDSENKRANDARKREADIRAEHERELAKVRDDLNTYADSLRAQRDAAEDKLEALEESTAQDLTAAHELVSIVEAENAALCGKAGAA